MSSPGQAIIAKLRAAAAVAALVEQRVYRAHAPQQPEFPLVVVQVEGDEALVKQRGGGRNVEVQARVYCFADRGPVAESLAAAVRSALGTGQHEDDDVLIYPAHRFSRRDADWELRDRLHGVLLVADLWARGPSM